VAKDSTILIDETFTKMDVNETITTPPTHPPTNNNKPADQFEGFTFMPKKKT